MQNTLDNLQKQFCKEFGLITIEYTVVNKDNTLWPKTKTDLIQLVKQGYKVIKVKRFYPLFTVDTLVKSIILLSHITDEPIGIGIHIDNIQHLQNIVLQNWLDLAQYGAFWEEEIETIEELRKVYGKAADKGI